MDWLCVYDIVPTEVTTISKQIFGDIHVPAEYALHEWSNVEQGSFDLLDLPQKHTFKLWLLSWYLVSTILCDCIFRYKCQTCSALQHKSQRLKEIFPLSRPEVDIMFNRFHYAPSHSYQIEWCDPCAGSRWHATMSSCWVCWSDVRQSIVSSKGMAYWQFGRGKSYLTSGCTQNCEAFGLDARPPTEWWLLDIMPTGLWGHAYCSQTTTTVWSGIELAESGPRLNVETVFPG